MVRVFYIVAVGVVLMATYEISALEARMTHDAGDASGTRIASSARIAVSDLSNNWGFAMLGGREALPVDRTLTSVTAVAYRSFAIEGHHFSFGLGAQYLLENQLSHRQIESETMPAASFVWQHRAFKYDIIASEKFTHTSLSFLLRIGLPIEANSDFEYLYSQPYRWSTNLFIFLNRYAGVVIGFEPLADRTRVGIWIKTGKDLQLRSLARLRASEAAYWEFSLTFRLTQEKATASQPATHKQEIAQRQQIKRPKKVPSFSVLTKWGVAPIEALQLARSKDICAASDRTKVLLAQHNWECRRER
jgi:hypothetical protein